MNDFYLANFIFIGIMLFVGFLQNIYNINNKTDKQMSKNWRLFYIVRGLYLLLVIISFLLSETGVITINV